MSLSLNIRNFYRCLVPMSFRVWLTRWRSYFSEIKVLRAAQKKLVCLLPEGLQSPVFLRRRTSDFFVYNEIFMGQSVYDFSLPFIPKLIIDCGGNIGLTSIFFATKYPDARIICIEPDTSNYNMLAKNIEPYKNIYGIHAGVWSKSTKLYITNPDVNAMSFRTNEVLADTVIDPSSHINAFDIEEIVKIGGGGGGDRVDLIKIDIEGAESELFSNNLESWLPKTRVIIIELHDANCTKIVKNTLHRYKFREVSFAESVGVYFNENIQ